MQIIIVILSLFLFFSSFINLVCSFKMYDLKSTINQLEHRLTDKRIDYNRLNKEHDKLKKSVEKFVRKFKVE